MPKLTTDQFIERAILKHGHEYSYKNVIYVNSKVKVKIRCKVHGPFEQTPTSHLAGQGCRKCSFFKSANKNKNMT